MQMTFPLKSLYILSLLVVFSCQQEQQPERLTKAQRFQEALDEEFRRTYDPALGEIPKDRLFEAVKATRQLQQEFANRRSGAGLGPKFIQRGPTDVGGRTRAILIDEADPERKRIIAGSVAGGLFITDDITENPPVWQNVNDHLDNLAVGALAQDPNAHNVMYMGTGEGFPNADAVRGVGIFKSEDSGLTWTLLESTTSGTIFRYTRGLVVHPVTSHVYAATRNGGVRRSEDGGLTWIKVLGVSLSASNDDMYDIQYSNGRLYASNNTNVYMSETGNRGEWEHITRSGSGFPTDLSRCEVTVCDADPNVMYAVGAISGSASDIYRTSDGGTSWLAVAPPTGGDFTNGQAWYDLDIAVDPFDCNHVIVGGVPIYRTRNGGLNWNRFANNMHVDQHKVVFDPLQPDVVYFGNDGGVWRSENGSANFVDSKNVGYITTQYYGCAIHPDTFSNYMLGGTQDNGTHQLDGPGASSARHVWGGDGFLCHIDEFEPRYQLVSSQFGNWGLSTNGGQTFSSGQSTEGNFLNPSDYDSESGILYAQTGGGNFYRWNVKTSLFELVSFETAGATISTVAVDPNVSNRVYFGMFGGRVVRVDNAHEGDVVANEILLQAGGTPSSIAIGNGAPDHIMVTFSNYGIDNSVMVSTDGGESWEMAEGNLPDMPVRWGIFNPKDPSSAMIATETGVWSTESLDGTATIWEPPLPGEGSPIVRTDMLQIRNSDFVVMAATHGRGLWTTSVFAQPRAKFLAPQVHYINSPLQFIGEVSLNASSYFWDFGDGATADTENPVHTFDEIGEYPVTLTINGNLSTTVTIKILPEVPLPYVAGEPEYGGSFEARPEQYGVSTTNGTAFERGVSNVIGKNGTKSGENAFVTGVNEPFYQDNTLTYLYLPAFDFSDQSIYTLNFWARYDLDPGPDGFNLEYSTDKGQTWRVLGQRESGWYNFNNSGVSSAFPDGTAYWTSAVGGFTNYKRNVSFLAGESDVAFRFVFRSESTGFHPGMAIDDFEISKFEGELVTNLITFSGGFTGDKEITLDWSTRPEYFCQYFEVQRSINGRDFEVIDVVNCKGGLSDLTQQYEHVSNGGRNLYFYRIRVVNEDTETGYFHEFMSETVTIRRKFEGVEVFRLFPNPFTDQVNFTFTDVVKSNIKFELYDATGRLMFEKLDWVDAAFYSLPLSQVPAGIYYLSVAIGEEKEEIFPIMGGLQ